MHFPICPQSEICFHGFLGREEGARWPSERDKDDRGLAEPYCWLGPVAHLRHEGERPITIIWRLAAPMPERLYRELRPAV